MADLAMGETVPSRVVGAARRVARAKWLALSGAAALWVAFVALTATGRLVLHENTGVLYLASWHLAVGLLAARGLTPRASRMTSTAHVMLAVAFSLATGLLAAFALARALGRSL